MRRDEFEHVIAAAANATGEDEFVVVGSQAILGVVANPPAAMLVSMEVDLYPRHAPEKADLIDGALGDGSPFHQAFGYYAHSVGPETAKAPKGWPDRAMAVAVSPRVGSDRMPIAYCLEPHDLVLAKLVRGSDRDWEYAGTALDAGIVRIDELLRRTADLPAESRRIEHIRRQLRALASEVIDGMRDDSR
ncbi:MAG TPA: hypothetical protein VFL73_02965 [Solirubrobacteraceae bacterium]|nr:hypothetical protein [Solirubrobacteraceae bacterium]